MKKKRHNTHTVNLNAKAKHEFDSMQIMLSAATRKKLSQSGTITEMSRIVKAELDGIYETG